MVKEIKKNRKYIFNFNEKLERKKIKEIINSYNYRQLKHSFFVKELVEIKDISGRRSCYLIITENKKSVIVKNYILDYLDIVPEIVQEQLDI
jgi:hypothetical protein